MPRNRIATTMASILVVTAALFAIGVAIERNAEAEHEAAEAPRSSPAPTVTEATERPTEVPEQTPNDESVPHEESEPHADSAEGAQEESTEGEEEPTGDSESEESSHAEEEPHAEGAEGEVHVEASETLFGIDIESPALVAPGVIASVVLATLVWLRPGTAIFAVVALFSLAFAGLDARELRHQLDEERLLLAFLAGSIALGHVAVALLGVKGLRSKR